MKQVLGALFSLLRPREGAAGVRLAEPGVQAVEALLAVGAEGRQGIRALLMRERDASPRDQQRLSGVAT
jgi:hypothetical protein